MNITRQYKLQQLGIKIPIKDKKIIDYLDKTLSGLKIIRLPKYFHSVFYFNHLNYCVLELREYNKHLHVRYNVFKMLEYNFKLNTMDCKIIIHDWVEMKYKLNIVKITQSISVTQIENEYKEEKKNYKQ